MKEIYKTIKIKHFTHYKVSNLGNVVNTKTNRLIYGVLVPSELKGFTAQIHLQNKKHRKPIMVHRLVAMYFKNEELGTNWVWHKDVNGLNNIETNLDINSHSDYLRKAAIIKGKRRGVYTFKMANYPIKYRATLKVNDKVVTLGYNDKQEDAEILYEFGYEMIFGESPYLKIA